jgi:hypothetical protein
MIRGFSLCRLAMREIPETERKLLRRICQTFLYRILRDVFSMPQEAIVILDSNIGKSALPNFARKSPLISCTAVSMAISSSTAKDFYGTGTTVRLRHGAGAKARFLGRRLRHE